MRADARRASHARRSGKALFAQTQGYRGDYSAVTEFIARGLRKASRTPRRLLFQLRLELGEAFQFAWNEEGLLVGGVFYKLQVTHVKLYASRAFLLVAYPCQGHEMPFDSHTHSFHALGGVARRGIYDSLKTAVGKVKKGKRRIVNARFSAMCSHYLFDPDFCNVASGWE
jgi:transposase